MKKAVFLSVITTLYKKDEASVADHLKAVDGDDIPDEKVEELIKEFDAEKVTLLKAEAKDRFDHGVKKGQKETSSKFEKKLKATFNLEDDSLVGDELLSKVEEITKETSAKADKDGKVDLSTITAEDLEKIPSFINKQRDFAKQLQDKEAEKEKAVADVKKSIKVSELKTKASTLALKALNEKNPILPKESDKAEKVKQRLLIDEIVGLNLMEAEDGGLIVLDEEGKPKESKNGVQLDFNTIVNDIIESNFEFSKSDPRSSAGNKNTEKEGEEGKKYTGAAPKSQKEYTDLLFSTELSTEEKASVKEMYKEQFN